MKKPLIKIEDFQLSFKVFGGNLNILDGINFDLWHGEKVGLVGETGCGKSTLMKMLIGSLSMSQIEIPKGKIFFKNRDLLCISEKERKNLRWGNMSMIFQDPTASLNPVFTIGTQIQDVIRYKSNTRNRSSKKEIKKQAIQILKEVSIPDPERILSCYPCQLSGGMCQRICIAMTMINTSKLLIADEPGTSLDMTIKDQIMRLLKELTNRRNTSIILISHALGSIRNLTDRVYVMYAGTIVEVAETLDLFDNALHPYSKGLLASIPRLTGEGIGSGIRGRIPEYMNPPSGCRFHPRCDFKMQICINEKPPFFKVSKKHKVACFLFRKWDGNFCE